MEEKLDKLEALDLSNQIITLENIKYKKLVDDYFIKKMKSLQKYY